ncbi:MAG: hypothetical protein HY901_21255 [Deltaproteobacteria bacterium]|nr:hypothetical protein [Deltaproteobacteria bacterium]
MSCPKCGSGAVFQGKCRECGTVVDSRRASAANVHSAASPLTDTGDETVLDSRRAPRRASSLDASPQRRLAVPDDPDATRLPAPPPRPSESGQPEAAVVDSASHDPDPAPAAPAAARRKSKQQPKPRSASQSKPVSAPQPKPTGASERERARAISERPSSAQVADEVSLGAARKEGGSGAAGAVLAALAIGDATSAALGGSPLAYGGAGLLALATVALWRSHPSGKALAWLGVAWTLVWAAALVVLFQQPLLAALKVLPAAALIGVFTLDARALRSALAGVGVAIALLGVAVPVLLHPRSSQGGLEPYSEIASQSGGSLSDQRLGYTIKLPQEVALSTSLKVARKWLPEEVADQVSPRFVFSTADKGFVGGLLASQQAPGVELSNLLTRLNPGSDPSERNSKLVPDSLKELETQGWEINALHGTTMVVLVRAPDGRAFALFGISPVASKVRGLQLFNSLAWGLQVKKSLGP